jgi:hypothetical protein
MTFRIVAIPLLAAISLATPAFASNTDAEEQRRRDRGGDNRRGADRGGDNRRRSAPRVRVAVPSRPIVSVNIGTRGPRYYAPSHYDRWARNHYRWSPIRFAPWGLISGSIGVAGFSAYSAYGAYGAYGTYGAYGAPYYAHGPHYPNASSYDMGGVRLRMRPRDAQVFVDGAYAGIVDDFDGTFQQLRLEAGAHKIEVRMPGFEDLEMDVHVQPGRTVTLHEDLRPRP